MTFRLATVFFLENYVAQLFSFFLMLPHQTFSPQKEVRSSAFFLVLASQKTRGYLLTPTSLMRLSLLVEALPSLWQKDDEDDDEKLVMKKTPSLSQSGPLPAISRRYNSTYKGYNASHPSMRPFIGAITPLIGVITPVTNLPVVPGQAGGGSFQKEKNYIAKKESAYRMCARRPTSAMPKSFLCLCSPSAVPWW